MAARIETLKIELAGKLVAADALTVRDGVATGHSPLDRYLLWKGLPKGALSLFQGIPGSGALGLWSQCAAETTRKGGWVAWLGHPSSSLCPWMLKQQKCDFSKLLIVSDPSDLAQRLWILQELMSSCLFEMIGCDLGEETFRTHQMVKLTQLARRYQTALVLLSQNPRPQFTGLYSLVLNFERQRIHVQRALHRPTPHLLERSHSYAHIMPQLTQGRAASHR